MNFKFFVGIDVSKDTLDISILKEAELVSQQKIDNTKTAIKKWMVESKKGLSATPTKTLYCLESTGIYGEILVSFLLSQKCKVWVESGLQISKSLGITRGKNDQIDSLRIAQYAFYNKQKLRLYEPKREIVQRLKNINTLKIRLLSCSLQLENAIRQRTGFSKVKLNKELEQMCKQSIKIIKKEYEACCDQILKLIKSDARLSHLYDIVISVPNIGPVTAVEMLIVTNEFKNFDSPKKFACYCGIAPFEHTSGTSVRGKTRVSGYANKRIKSLFHMAAMGSITRNQEMKGYYKRKVEQGKPKMAVINAIRNKLIHRIFACVLQDRLFEKGYVPKPHQDKVSEGTSKTKSLQLELAEP